MPWRTDSDRVAELDGMTHRAAYGPAGATAVSRRYTGSWAAFIEDGSTAVHDRAAGTAWLERIHQRAAQSAAAGRMGFVLDASDNKEAFSK